MIANIVYVIEMPNKPIREISGINYIKVSEQVIKMGGKIYPKPIKD